MRISSVNCLSLYLFTNYDNLERKKTTYTYRLVAGNFLKCVLKQPFFNGNNSFCLL